MAKRFFNIVKQRKEKRKALEFYPILSKPRPHDIIVTAVHNHWLFDKPRLMFMHFESIDKSNAFANKVRDALSILTTKEMRPAKK